MLTREEIEIFPAGEALDNLIQEHIFEFKEKDWKFSTDISAAQKIVDKADLIKIEKTFDGLWWCYIIFGKTAVEGSGTGMGETQPEAICRAALEAMWYKTK